MSLKSVIIFLGFLIGSSNLFASIVPDTIKMADFEGDSWVCLDSTDVVFFTDEPTTAYQFLNSKDQVLTGNVSHYNIEQWLYIYVENNQKFPDQFYFNLNKSFENAELHVIESNEIVESNFSGSLTPLTLRQIANHSEILFVNLAANESKLLLFKLYNFTNRKGNLELLGYGNKMINNINQDLADEAALQQNAFQFGFQGAVIMLLLFMGLLFVYNRSSSVYLYFAFYLALISFYFLLGIAHNGPFYFLFPNSPFLRESLNSPLELLMVVGFNVFLLKFLAVKERSKTTWNLMWLANIIFIVMAIGEFTYTFLTRDLIVLQELFFPVNVILLVVGVLLFLGVLKTLKSPSLNYVIWGNGFFIGFCVLAILYALDIYHISLPFLPDLGIAPILMVQIGLLIQVLFLSLGIGKLTLKASVEAGKVRNSDYDQLEERLNVSQQKVDELESDLVIKNRELNTVNSNQQKLELERELLDREMRILRLQMNPHFIFNSLNSIRYFILKQNGDKAIEYIESFSKLLRMVLDYSKQSFITIEEELSALTLYITFEQERLSPKFDFNLEIDSSLDVSSLLIQPLLLQPFVENSIWHGLMHKTEKGNLKISIQKSSPSQITIVIEDDGVGRAESAKRNADKHAKNKSLGSEITQNRIALSNNGMNKNYGFEIIDLKDSDGKPVGTKVLFTIDTQSKA